MPAVSAKHPLQTLKESVSWYAHQYDILMHMRGSHGNLDEEHGPMRCVVKHLCISLINIMGP